MNHVIETHETIVSNTAGGLDSFQGDPYLEASSPKSLYCTPLLHEAKLKGVLYLENNSREGAFHQDSIELIDMHTFQLAMLLDNIEIYQALEKLNRTLENKVRKRTREVENQRDEISAQRDEIQAQRDLLTEQKDQIEKQNQSVTDSIRYASRIQKAIMPSEELLKFFFPKYFVLYRPRDIVSGDFYWIGQKNNSIIVSVIDCTGHGVPGAFMSVLGTSLLNEVLTKPGEIKANEILNELRDKVIASLGQTGSHDEAKDGMDMALCVYYPDEYKLQFSGAENPLWIIRDSELIEIKGDRMPVGIDERAGRSFTNHEVDLHKGDSLYMMSDGYADQFGGPKNKRLCNSKMKEILLASQDRIMFEQKRILEKEFDDWKGNTDQIDDVLVLGLKI